MLYVVSMDLDTYLYDDTIMGMSYDLTYERVSVFYSSIKPIKLRLVGLIL